MGKLWNNYWYKPLTRASITKEWLVGFAIGCVLVYAANKKLEKDAETVNMEEIVNEVPGDSVEITGEDVTEETTD